MEYEELTGRHRKPTELVISRFDMLFTELLQTLRIHSHDPYTPTLNNTDPGTTSFDKENSVYTELFLDNGILAPIHSGHTGQRALCYSADATIPPEMPLPRDAWRPEHRSKGVSETPTHFKAAIFIDAGTAYSVYSDLCRRLDTAKSDTALLTYLSTSFASPTTVAQSVKVVHAIASETRWLMPGVQASAAFLMRTIDDLEHNMLVARLIRRIWLSRLQQNYNARRIDAGGRRSTSTLDAMTNECMAAEQALSLSDVVKDQGWDSCRARLRNRLGQGRVWNSLEAIYGIGGLILFTTAVCDSSFVSEVRAFAFKTDLN